MRLIVQKINDPKPGKFGDGLVTRVVFEDIDTPKKWYYLNLNDDYKKQSEKWLPFLKPGNILDCTIWSGTVVSLFVLPKMVKEMKSE